jgi:hypothetical protein
MLIFPFENIEVANMSVKLKIIRIKGITKNPLIDKLKAKRDQTFFRFRSKFS